MKTMNACQNDSTKTSIIKSRRMSPILNAHQGLGDVEVFVGLGLSGRQARVYLALLKLGNAKADAVADISSVNRQDIYLLLDSLQQIGLVQKKITHPTTFTATPINQALQMLLQHKTQQLDVINKKISVLAKKYRQPARQQDLLGQKPCLGTISEGDHGKKHQTAIQNTQHSIDALVTWRQFRQIAALYEAQLKAALKRGISIRVVTQKLPNQTLPIWATTATNPSFQLTAIATPPTATFTIFDKTTAVIAFSNTVTPKSGLYLWTTNPTLIALTQTCFNAKWKQTKQESTPCFEAANM
jgi:sugar-specific transcriptional regulator TrmB